MNKQCSIFQILLLVILFFGICVKSYSQKKVGDQYKGGTLYEIYADGSGGKVVFFTAANNYDDAQRFLKDHYENGIKCYMADDYDLQTLFQLRLIGPDKGDGTWNNYWWMGDRRMASYGSPFEYTASGILNLPITSSGNERTANILQFGSKADRYNNKAYLAVMGIVSWPKGSNVYKPTAAEIKQAQIDDKKTGLETKNNVIGTPIKIGSLEVAQYDFPKIPWNDANNSCKGLGNGWRLPTKQELNILYQNRDVIGNFKWDSYWSSTKGTVVIAWRLNFGDGMIYDRDNTDNTACVRAVRKSINNNKTTTK